MSLQYWGRNFAGQSAQYAATPVTFSSLPPASSVEGQVRVLSDVNYIEVVSRGGVWRPRGGRQVLQARYINPVTAQDLSDFKVENIGPFPGGLVRSGMRVSLAFRFSAPAISTSGRVLRPCIGPVGNAGGDTYGFGYVAISNSAAVLSGEFDGKVDVISNTSANHVGTPPSNVGGSVTGPAVYFAPTAFENPLVDFSQPWEVGIWIKSVAETAVTITGAAWSAGVATYTTSANHTLAVGDKDVISGITPSGYNGTFIVSAVGSPTTFSVPMAANPGAYTSGGSSSRISPLTSQSYSLELWG